MVAGFLSACGTPSLPEGTLGPAQGARRADPRDSPACATHSGVSTLGGILTGVSRSAQVAGGPTGAGPAGWGNTGMRYRRGGTEPSGTRGADLDASNS